MISLECYETLRLVVVAVWCACLEAGQCRQSGNRYRKLTQRDNIWIAKPNAQLNADRSRTKISELSRFCDHTCQGRYERAVLRRGKESGNLT